MYLAMANKLCAHIYSYGVNKHVHLSLPPPSLSLSLSPTHPLSLVLSPHPPSLSLFLNNLLFDSLFYFLKSSHPSFTQCHTYLDINLSTCSSWTNTSHTSTYVTAPASYLHIRIVPEDLMLCFTTITDIPMCQYVATHMYSDCTGWDQLSYNMPRTIS